MTSNQGVPAIAAETLRAEIRKEYATVAQDPGKGYHFHTGWAAASRLGYAAEHLAGVPAANLASFAGTGNPFAAGGIRQARRLLTWARARAWMR